MSTTFFTVHERLKMILGAKTTESRRFKELEELTGIPSATWKTYWTRGSRPSAELIEAVSRRWPEHAFWLASGLQDPTFGHTGAEEAKETPDAKAQPSSAAFLQAAARYTDEAEKVLQAYWEADAKDLSYEVRELTKRNAADFDVLEQTEVKHLRSEVHIAAKVRWVEILVDVYLPEFGYEETEAALPIAEKKLSDAEHQAAKVGMSIDTRSVRRKIADVRAQLIKWHSWKDKALPSDIESTEKKAE